LYDSLAMDKRLPAGRYFSFHHTVAVDRSIRGRANLVDGVNWMLVDGREPELDLYRRLRLVHNAEGELVFCRLSGVPEAELWKLLPEMDRILVVIDPLPSSMLAGYERLCQLRTEGSPITYIVNKYNDGVDRRELLQFLKRCMGQNTPAEPYTTCHRRENCCNHPVERSLLNCFDPP